MKNYDDIISLPHHVSKKHPQMSRENRAAQFAPFAALTGYDDAVKETARLTCEKPHLTDEKIAIINNKLSFLNEHLDDDIQVSITHFVPDSKKSGGSYVQTECTVNQIEAFNRIIILSDKTKIKMENIMDISSDIFSSFGF